MPDGKTIDRLYEVILSRKGADPDTSYTAKLFSRGRAKIAQKLGEEAVEMVIAALVQKKDEMIGESADLLYHLIALWADCGVTPSEVWAELNKRRGLSGIEEKKSRKG
jgi:phosphoribosyl-ATP pyrophosphohydrolase